MYYENYVNKGYTATEAYHKTVRRFHDAVFRNYSYPKVRKGRHVNYM